MLSLEEAIAKYDGKKIKASTTQVIEDLGQYYTAHLNAVENGRIISVSAIITDSVADRFRELWVDDEGEEYNLTYIDKYAPTIYIERNLERYGWTHVDDDEGHFGCGHTNEPFMQSLLDFQEVHNYVILTPEFLVECTKENKERMGNFYNSRGQTPPWKKSD
jgi:hypothetical protein